MRRPAGRGRGVANGGREAVAQARRRHPRSRKELLVIESDHLRAPPGLQVALEIGRNVDRGNGIAAADRPRRGREVARAFDDAETGRHGHLFHEGARGVRPVRVDDDHPEPADDRMTEHPGQDCEGK